MSVSQFVFLRDERLPTLEQWQAALDRAGVGITLDPVGDLRVHSGFLPARHHEHPSGFEWHYGPVAENLGGPAPAGVGAHLDTPAGKDLLAEVRWELDQRPNTRTKPRRARAPADVVAAALRAIYTSKQVD